jgi:hypothetical protein
MIKLPLRQRLLSHSKERREVPPSTGLPKSKQMDNTELIPTPANQRPYLRSSRVPPIFKV